MSRFNIRVTVRIRVMAGVRVRIRFMVKLRKIFIWVTRYEVSYGFEDMVICYEETFNSL